jgi:hypothetical protein
LSGKIRFSWRVIGQAQRHQAEVLAPAKICVQPQVTHKVEALEDVAIIECNGLQDIENDRYREEV